jgi:purine-nucleoside phosphorylase
MDYYNAAESAAHFLKDQFQKDHDLALIIGSGGARLLDNIDIQKRIPFSAVPHLVAATYLKGEWISGRVGQHSILILNGRLHYYEGYSMQEVTFPIRILKLLGITKLLMTNAAGGLNPNYKAGEVILVKDHINLFPEHPLRGANDERLGIRFPDMSQAYAQELRAELQSTAMQALGHHLKEGVYIGLQGPSLETPAEYKYLNIIGGDLVGMSTVPEVIVANHCGISTAVLSVVTNVCYPPEVVTETTLEEVVEIADRASGMVLGPIISTLLSS